MASTTDTLKFGLRDAVPPEALAAWGARLIYPDDVLADRSDCVGSDQARRELLDYLRKHVGARPWERAREMHNRGELHARDTSDVTLYEDERCIVLANPRGGSGYLYVAAWMKPPGEPAASATPEVTVPEAMTNFTAGERVVIDGRKRATFRCYGDPRCACPPGHVSWPGMRIVIVELPNGREDSYWERDVESVADNPTLDVSGWRGRFAEGWTPADIDHVLGYLEGYLGTPLRCVWDYVDRDGCGGDSRLVAIVDGTALDLPAALWDLLVERSGDGRIDPDTFASARRSEVDLTELSAYTSRTGHNLAREDRRKT